MILFIAGFRLQSREALHILVTHTYGKAAICSTTLQFVVFEVYGMVRKQ